MATSEDATVEQALAVLLCGALGNSTVCFDIKIQLGALTSAVTGDRRLNATETADIEKLLMRIQKRIARETVVEDLKECAEALLRAYRDGKGGEAFAQLAHLSTNRVAHMQRLETIVGTKNEGIGQLLVSFFRVHENATSIEVPSTASLTDIKILESEQKRESFNTQAHLREEIEQLNKDNASFADLVTHKDAEISTLQWERDHFEQKVKELEDALLAKRNKEENDAKKATDTAQLQLERLQDKYEGLQKDLSAQKDVSSQLERLQSDHADLQAQYKELVEREPAASRDVVPAGREAEKRDPTQESKDPHECVELVAANQKIQQLQTQTDVGTGRIVSLNEEANEAVAVFNSFYFEVETLFTKVDAIARILGKDRYIPNAEKAIKRAERQEDLRALQNARMVSLRDPLPALIRITEGDCLVLGNEPIKWLHIFAQKVNEQSIPQIAEIVKSIPVPERPEDPAIKEEEERKKAKIAASASSSSRGYGWNNTNQFPLGRPDAVCSCKYAFYKKENDTIETLKEHVQEKGRCAKNIKDYKMITGWKAFYDETEVAEITGRGKAVKGNKPATPSQLSNSGLNSLQSVTPQATKANVASSVIGIAGAKNESTKQQASFNSTASSNTPVSANKIADEASSTPTAPYTSLHDLASAGHRVLDYGTGSQRKSEDKSANKGGGMMSSKYAR
ncbi:hypothetical protein BDV96DRAFT_637133 [Lophiotrema nucula]|uniref:Uncharacterized protein n=1 Tax=Lophiotrema nucula TaxID=690887 RepID=A0A6A5YM27_9PLEO|nr:hypothetical protein BDV96DRAFT_637133 [Lophiotrema nucula]